MMFDCGLQNIFRLKNGQSRSINWENRNGEKGKGGMASSNLGPSRKGSPCIPKIEAGETVTIKATYTPFSASVDFGLIAPDGYFYYLNADDGSFDETIKVDERGNYTFAVQNNSSKAVSVSGYVNY